MSLGTLPCFPPAPPPPPNPKLASPAHFERVGLEFLKATAVSCSCVSNFTCKPDPMALVLALHSSEQIQTEGMAAVGEARETEASPLSPWLCVQVLGWKTPSTATRS